LSALRGPRADRFVAAARDYERLEILAREELRVLGDLPEELGRHAITAYATADVMPWGDTGSVANTSGTSGVPLNLGTTHSGYTSSSTEGTITATRIFDTQLLPPTAPYVKQFPLNREPDMTVQKFIRIRNTFGTAINAYYYVIFVV